MDQFRFFLNRWVIGGSFLVACFLSFLFLVLVNLSRNPEPQQSFGTAVVSIIDAPTSTAIPVTMTIEPQSTSLPEDNPVSAPDSIVVGSYVQVVGTGGDGLRLRVEPGLDNQVLILADEAEVFRVGEGPVDLDGHTWWYLVGAYDESRNGWGVSDYLVPVEDQ